MDAEVQQNEAIPLSEEEIALDVSSSEGMMSSSGSGGEEICEDRGATATPSTEGLSCGLSYAIHIQEAVEQVIMGRTNVGRRGRSGCGGGRGLSDHEAACGWGQISIRTNTSGVQKIIRTNTSGTHFETNATITSDTGVQKSIRTNTSGTRYETNATMSSDTQVQKTIRTNTSGTRSETNIGVQKSIGTNTSGARSETNATMSSDTWAQEPVGDDEPNTDVSQRRRGSNIIEQVPQDPSKRTMISLDDGEFTDPKVVRKITSILKTMFNGSWTTWKEVDKSGRDELWAHFKELFKWEGLSDVLVHNAWKNSMKKRYPDITLKAKLESMKLAKAAGEQVHKRPPTAAELFELTHMKNGAFVTLKSERVAAAYNGALVEKYGSDPANHPIYDDDLWKQCAGDDKKGRVFGWGSMSDPQYTMTGTPSTTRCTGAPSGSKDVQERITKKRTKNKDKTTKLDSE
ncbi:transposase, Ptta/En/Spm [Tanacetum coccineum]